MNFLHNPVCTLRVCRSFPPLRMWAYSLFLPCVAHNPQTSSSFLLASLSLFSSLFHTCILQLKDCVFNWNLQMNCLNKQTINRLYLSKNNKYKTKNLGLEGKKWGRGIFKHTVTTIPYERWTQTQLTLKNAELNPICHLLALLGAHHILHVGRIRVKPYIHGIYAVLIHAVGYNSIYKSSTYTTQ